MSTGSPLPTSPESRSPSSDAGSAGRSPRGNGVLVPAARVLLALLGALVWHQIAGTVDASVVVGIGGPGVCLFIVTLSGVKALRGARRPDPRVGCLDDGTMIFSRVVS
jgi:hypothetical protein